MNENGSMIEDHTDEGLDERDHQFRHALEDAQEMVAMQGITINALQNRIWHLEMEIVDLMAQALATRVSELPELSPEVSQ